MVSAAAAWAAPAGSGRVVAQHLPRRAAAGSGERAVGQREAHEWPGATGRTWGAGDTGDLVHPLPHTGWAARGGLGGLAQQCPTAAQGARLVPVSEDAIRPEAHAAAGEPRQQEAADTGVRVARHGLETMVQSRASAAQHFLRQTVLKARTGQRKRESAASQRSPWAARAPAAITPWPGHGAPTVWSHVCRTMGHPIGPPRWRGPHGPSGWRAAVHSSVNRGLVWARMRGVRSWGTGNTRGTEGTGRRAAWRSSTHWTGVHG